MNDHPLVATAARKVHVEAPALPSDARYDILLGLWMLGDQPLASSEGAGFGPRVTKKADQETGEDQKGE